MYARSQDAYPWPVKCSKAFFMNIMAIAKVLYWFTSVNVHAATLYTVHMHVRAIPQNFSPL